MRTSALGVSIVIPAYRGPEALEVTLSSLLAQTVECDRFEVVVVVNGPAATDLASFEEVRERCRPLRIRLITTAAAGASMAWNIGVQSARMGWITFLDDDDTVTPRFLGALLEVAVPGVMPLTEIHDLRPDGTVDQTLTLNQRIRSGAGTRVPATRLPQALGFNASKLVPATWAKRVRYPPKLTNGQDIAYFGTLSLRHDITFAVPEASAEAAYVRTLSNSSMSRKEMSYEFSIEQRLDVIESLDRVRPGTWRSRQAASDHLVEAQVQFMNRYLRAHPDRRQNVLTSITSRSLSKFPYRALNRGLSTRLAVVCGDPPWQKVRSWAAASKQPIDVAILGPARKVPGIVSINPVAQEFDGRVMRFDVLDTPDCATGARNAADAIDNARANEPPYLEVASSPDGLAVAVVSELIRRHPSLQRMTELDGTRHWWRVWGDEPGSLASEAQ